MAVSHVKSNTVGDWTGTVTVGNSNGSTMTIAATDLIRPVDWNSAHNQLYTLSGNTNNASTASGTNVVLQGVGGITLIGSTGTIGVSANAPGTLHGFDPFSPGGEWLADQQGQSTLHLHEFYFPAPVQLNQLIFPIYVTANTNSTGTWTVSQILGLYTHVNSTQISRYASWEVTTVITHSGTASSGNLFGLRTWSGAVAATTIPVDDYVVAWGSKTTSGGAPGTLSNFVVSQMNTAFSGHLGSANNASVAMVPFQGSFSAQTAGLPNSIGTADIRGSAAVAWGRPPIWSMGST